MFWSSVISHFRATIFLVLCLNHIQTPQLCTVYLSHFSVVFIHLKNPKHTVTLCWTLMMQQLWPQHLFFFLFSFGSCLWTSCCLVLLLFLHVRMPCARLGACLPVCLCHYSQNVFNVHQKVWSPVSVPVVWTQPKSISHCLRVILNSWGLVLHMSRSQ